MKDKEAKELGATKKKTEENGRRVGMHERDKRRFERLVLNHGSSWMVEQLIALGGCQLIMLHLANDLSQNPRTVDESKLLLELAVRLDEFYGWNRSLACALFDFQAMDFSLEPKPNVIRAVRVNLGEKSQLVLELLDRMGHRVVGDEVVVRYRLGVDTNHGTEAADLIGEIREVAGECGCTDLSGKLTPLYGLGPQTC